MIPKQPKEADATARALTMGLNHHRAGRLAEAEKIYRDILARQPRQADALHLLGVLLGQTGRPQLAVDYISRAIALRPGVADFHGNLGEFLRPLQRHDESAASFRRAIAIKQDEPNFHNGLGVTLAEAAQYDQAIAEFRRAIELDRDTPDAFNNLGGALTAIGRFDEAIAAIREAIRLQPRMYQAHNHLGRALALMGQYQQAIAAFSRALAIKPSDVPTCANLALVHLVLGDFQRGWAEYESRLYVSPFVGMRKFNRPRWSGEDLNGQTILLYPEQGFGDLIQFVRFIPELVAGGANVILETPPELVRLFRGIARIVPENDPLPPHDVHCPLISVAGVLGVMPQTIPAPIPYLKPEADLAAAWARRFDPNDRRLRVGLVWAGRPSHFNERNRSMKLADLAPLAEVEGVAFFSLQKGDGAAQAANPPPGMTLIDWTAELNDFADTAALLANLDLLITIDSSPAHLAGAMGKKVWVMLPKVPDWRWLLDREDSPWYPTMRLFRQTSAGDWADVVRRVRDVLSAEAAGRGEFS